MKYNLKLLAVFFAGMGLAAPQLASAKEGPRRVEKTSPKAKKMPLGKKRKAPGNKPVRKSKPEAKAKFSRAQLEKRVGKITSRIQYTKDLKAIKLKDIISKGPKVKLKDCSGKKGRAVILYHYMGDSYLTALAQDTVKLAPIFDSYDYKVLVKFPVEAGVGKAKFNLSAKAFKEADKVYDPTATNFIKAIRHVVDKGYTVDIFLLSHGTTDNGVAHFVVSDGTLAPPGFLMSMNTVEAGLAKEHTGCSKLPIRMVYHMACFGSQFAAAWKRLGARVSIGTRFINFYPTQMGKFVKLFNQGKTVKQSVEGADTKVSRGLVQTYLQILDAPASKFQGKWPGCPFGRHVMGKHNCAVDYFKDRWDLSSSQINWSQTKKGRAVANRSSSWIITGDRNITKNSR